MSHDDLIAGGCQFDLAGGRLAAECATQRFFSGIPSRLTATGRTRELLLSNCFSHYEAKENSSSRDSERSSVEAPCSTLQEFIQGAPRDPPSAPDFLPFQRTFTQRRQNIRLTHSQRLTCF